MKIAIIGYGGQGQAAVEYWTALDANNELTVCDKNAGLKLPKGIASRLGPKHLEGLDEFDLIIRTPSLHPRDIVSANPDAPAILDKVTTVTNEFMRVCPTKNIIGVTGTKGKGTTSTLITKILEAAGHRVHLGGNIGIPPLELLARHIKPDDWVVLELANFQLIDLKHAPHIGVCVMVAPEHLDWHTDMAEYVEAKAQMFRLQTTSDLAVFNRLNEYSEQIASVSTGTKLSYEVPEPGAAPTKTTGAYVKDDVIYMDDTEICAVGDVALLGRHNLQNICAAIAATWEVINRDADLIKHVVQNLKGLPNRLEPVRTLNEITYYNDSFAAAPGATSAALEAIHQPKVLIVGGFDRMLPLDELVESIKDHQKDIRKILFIGASGERVASACKEAGFTNFEVSTAQTMPEIVAQASTFAKAGDAVVLSPGFPSFDMFTNFAVRGEKFREAVEEL